MPSTNTNYYPGGVQTQTEGGYGGQVGAQLGALMPDFDRLLQYQAGQAGRRQGFQEEMGRGQLDLQRQELAMRQQQQEQQQAQQRVLGMRENADRNRALSDRGDPYFIKPMTGFNMSGGYGRASAGDPGAIIGGYIPRGSQPQSATFQGQPGAGYQQHYGQQQPTGTTGGYDPFSFNASYGGGALGPEADRQRAAQAAATRG